MSNLAEPYLKKGERKGGRSSRYEKAVLTLRNRKKRTTRLRKEMRSNGKILLLGRVERTQTTILLF